jgi:hypothetical protein
LRFGYWIINISYKWSLKLSLNQWLKAIMSWTRAIMIVKQMMNTISESTHQRNSVVLKFRVWFAWWVVLPSILFLEHFTSGEELVTFYCNTGPYCAAYMKSKDPGVTQSTLQIVFPILGIATNSVLSFGVKIA